jgi:hypothetical protein
MSKSTNWCSTLIVFGKQVSKIQLNAINLAILIEGPNG